MARDRAAAAGPPVQGAAVPGTAAAVPVVLSGARGAAHRGRVADRLLGRLLLHGPHGAAPAADVRRAVADRRGCPMAAAARRAAQAVRAVGYPRGADGGLVTAAAPGRRALP